jgi:predicted ATPase
LLLILDNCEHLVAAVAGLVERLLLVSPGLTVLATSREGLAVAGEHVMPIGPMGLPLDQSPRSVHDADAARLFVERAGDVQSGFAVGSDNAGVVAQLCRRLDGIPLAIELAAARVRSMAPADILDHLDQRFRLLTGGRRTALTRQQTLRGAIDWSYDLLDQPEQAMLRRLAAFAGGFDLAAAEAVAGWGDIQPLDVCDLMDRLVDKSLVLADLSGVTARYRLLEMIRDYAWERSGEAGETEEVCRRDAGYFVAFAEKADAGLRGPDEVPWTEAVERELDNLRAAVSWAAGAGEADLALRVITHLAPAFGNRIGAPFGAIAECAAEEGRAVGHPLRCVALASAARSASDVGDLDKSRGLAEAALAAATDLPPGKASAWARCRALSGISTTIAGLGQPEKQIALAEQRVAAAGELDDPWERARALTMLAGVYSFDAEKGVPAGRESVSLARQLANPSQLSLSLMMLAPAVAASDAAEAEAMLQEAIAIASEVSKDFAGIFARQSLAAVRAQRGDRRAPLPHTWMCGTWPQGWAMSSVSPIKWVASRAILPSSAPRSPPSCCPRGHRPAPSGPTTGCSVR